MKNTLSWKDGIFYLNGKEDHLISGEFHYFRVPKADWRTRLRLWKEAGGNTIATYIPWLIHEPEEGRFSFGEHDYDDLAGFLEACREEGVLVVARPGPYQYSELKCAGLPEWLCSGYGNLLAKNLAGESFCGDSISYMHPLFLEKAKKWMTKVLGILRPWCAAEGGPIIALQLDNEAVGIHSWFNGGWYDYNPETFGFGQPEGRFPRFLKERYADHEALSEAWEEKGLHFTTAMPICRTAKTAGDVRRLLDYEQCYLKQVEEYFSWLRELIHEAGIREKLIHNSPNPEANSNFFEIADAMGEEFLLGSDHYYNLNQNWAQNNPTPQYAVRNFISLELLRNMGVPPTVFELPSGSASDWPPITPVDSRAAYVTNIAMGMKGWNYYIYTGGPNVPGTGSTTDLYDYGAPIGPFGEIRPLYGVQKQVHALCEANGTCSSALLEDFYVGYDRTALRPYSYEGFWHPGFVSPKRSWELCQQGLLTTAFCAGFTPKLVDLCTARLPTDKAIAIVTGTVMSRRAQKQLTDYLTRGGKLMMGPELPVLDENLQPCTLLADALRLPELENHAGGIIDMEGNPNIMATGGIHSCRPQDSCATLAKLRKGNRAVSFLMKRGNATVLWNGWSWTHCKTEHIRALGAMLAAVGVKPLLHKSDSNVFAVLHKSCRGRILFALNLYSSPMETEIQIAEGPHYRLQLAPMETRVICCDTPEGR